MDHINLPKKGMLKDYSPFEHGDNHTTFTLNGIYSNKDGDITIIQTEHGNEKCWKLPEGYSILGHVNMGRDEILVISKSNTKTQFGIVTKGCNYKMLIDTSCLESDLCFYMKGLFRILRGCERVVYLYDGKNNDLSINIDDLQQYTQSYQVEVNGKSITKKYTVEEANENDLWDCNEMRLEPDFLIPCISSVNILDGVGELDLGKWRFAVELLDANQNRIGISPISQGVDIWDEDTFNTWLSIDGGYNFNENQFTPDIGGVPSTNKAVELTLSNLDTRFAFARVYGIVKRTGGGLTTEVFGKGDLIRISSSNQTYVFDRIDISNGDFTTTLTELTTIKDRYKSSKKMEFIDRRLVRFNLTQDFTDWSSFQRSASAIGISYIINEIDVQSKQKGDSKNPTTAFDSLSLMGDEIEPHAIVYEFKQGFFSPAFHIPGRPKDKGVNNSLLQGISQQALIVSGNNSIWEIEYEFNGIIYKDSGTFIEQDSYAIFYGNPNIINFSFTGTGYSQYEINNFTPLGNSQSDSTQISTWSEDLIPFGYPDANSYNGELENWQVYNTAFKETETRGQVGYYETSSCYPDIRDCNGESIWGVDICGNELINTPIRHPKMPDRCLEPHVDLLGTKIRLIGLKFNNIQYPHPDIIGHHFVRARKLEGDKTVVSNGWMSNVCNDEENNYIGIGYIQNDPSVHNQYLSAETLINGRSVTGTYAKETIQTLITPEQFIVPNDVDIQEAAKKFGGDDLQLGIRALKPLVNACDVPNFYQIEENYMINAMSKTPSVIPIVNLLWDNKSNYIKYNREAGSKPTVRYTSLKRNKEVYANLETIQYYRTHSCSFNKAGSEVFTGNTYISELTHWRELLADIDTSNEGNIWTVIGIVVTAALSVISAGLSVAVASIIAGAGISAVAISTLIEELKEGRYEKCRKDNALIGDDGWGFFGLFSDGYVVFNSEYIRGLWVESNLNFDMIHSGTSEYTVRFNDFRGDTFRNELIAYAKYKSTTQDPEDSTKQVVRDFIIPESYLYNLDYSGDQIGNIYLPLSFNFDYCSNCGEKRPNSTIWSEVSFENEISDGNRVFLPLNRIEIGTHSGQITDAKFDKNRLIVTTENSVFAMAPNPRILQSDAEQIYTGVGDFLSIPEQEFVKTSYGYGGNQGRFSAVNTPFGWIYPDAESGEIFLYDTALKRISDAGMRNWFKENLPINLKCSLEEKGLNFHCLDNINQGVGLFAIYDPRYTRYILTKRDYLPINFQGERGTVEGLYYRNTQWIYRREGGQEFRVTLGDPKYFENKSWTISYSFMDGGIWASFHSYLPSYMINDHNTFYSFNKDNQSWIHNNHNYTNYYGIKRDWIVEYVINNPVTEDLHNIHYYSQGKEYKEGQWINVDSATFDRMLVYNSCQSTGLQNLKFIESEPYGISFGWSNITKNLIKTEKDYKISEIRDLSISQPVNTNLWENLDYQSEYNSGGYIDLVPNNSNLDYNRNQHRLPDLKDKYHIVRLYAKPSIDAHIELNLVNSKTFTSIH